MACLTDMLADAWHAPIGTLMEPSNPLDIIGIGFGPANLALAIAFEELTPAARIRFIEARHNPLWQGEMMLDGADIQNHPSRDLVTLRNPRSRYTFTNYLFEEGRLIEQLNLPLHFPISKGIRSIHSVGDTPFRECGGLRHPGGRSRRVHRWRGVVRSRCDR